MPDGDGDDPGGGVEKRKVPNRNQGGPDEFYKTFIKPEYKRMFAESAVSGEFSVFVEGLRESEKIGNVNPIITTNLFKNDIKGITNIKRINPNKICVTFSQSNNANNFIKNEAFLSKHQFKAFIPASAVECIGVLKFVPTSISNAELFKKLSSRYEIIAVRRFTKKENGELKPYKTVSLTFLSNVLPEYVYLDLFRFKVHEYHAPLLQCFKCFKFNHGAKICKNSQKCSICTEEHHFSECVNKNNIKCINCQGPHLAISRECPIKRQKIEAKKSKTYANVISGNYRNNNISNYERNFPQISTVTKTNTKTSNPASLSSVVSRKPSPIPTAASTNSETISNERLINEIINNDFIRKGLIGALISIGNENRAITSNVIQDILIKTFKT
ncbi:uncharacterized protein LOC142984892 [Anticarsia gemmatalis]|uniref:uncharacterized protein LOC142984892 n=1 Tax=Anticarsia gemmatalis TaxID=129554 RepID=UPI003F761E56